MKDFLCWLLGHRYAPLDYDRAWKCIRCRRYRELRGEGWPLL